MIRRPPRSTLFPTRRSSDLQAGPGREGGAEVERGAEQRHRGLEQPARAQADAGAPALARLPGRPDRRPEQDRSEEHTSELQSRQYLVCRLLLEKKKPINTHL